MFRLHTRLHTGAPCRPPPPSPHTHTQDYSACKWPEGFPGASQLGSDDTAAWFDAANESNIQQPGWAMLQQVLAGSNGSSGHTDVISFSHFLPHQDLLPEKRMLTYPNLVRGKGASKELQAKLQHARGGGGRGGGGGERKEGGRWAEQRKVGGRKRGGGADKTAGGRERWRWMYSSSAFVSSCRLGLSKWLLMVFACFLVGTVTTPWTR